MDPCNLGPPDRGLPRGGAAFLDENLPYRRTGEAGPQDLAGVFRPSSMPGCAGTEVLAQTRLVGAELAQGVRRHRLERDASATSSPANARG